MAAACEPCEPYKTEERCGPLAVTQVGPSAFSVTVSLRQRPDLDNDARNRFDARNRIPKSVHHSSNVLQQLRERGET